MIKVDSKGLSSMSKSLDDKYLDLSASVARNRVEVEELLTSLAIDPSTLDIETLSKLANLLMMSKERIRSVVDDLMNQYSALNSSSEVVNEHIKSLRTSEESSDEVEPDRKGESNTSKSESDGVSRGSFSDFLKKLLEDADCEQCPDKDDCEQYDKLSDKDDKCECCSNEGTTSGVSFSTTDESIKAREDYFNKASEAIDKASDGALFNEEEGYVLDMFPPEFSKNRTFKLPNSYPCSDTSVLIGRKLVQDIQYKVPDTNDLIVNSYYACTNCGRVTKVLEVLPRDLVVTELK